MSRERYVHGHSPRERDRLLYQANTLSELLHHETSYPAGSFVLEAGCGIGAQTVILAGNSPEARIVSLDISRESVETARRSIQAGMPNVTFLVGDLYALPVGLASFDHVFVCFVLEHLERPLEALGSLSAALKPGGSITVIEGDHGSATFHPQSREASRAIQCLIDLQAELRGNSLIGRQVYPLLKAAGFDQVRVSPRMVYADSSRPEIVEGFTKNTFIAMVEGVRERALSAGMMDEATWERGIADLHRTTAPDGVFCYTFFKGVGVKWAPPDPCRT